MYLKEKPGKLSVSGLIYVSITQEKIKNFHNETQISRIEGNTKNYKIEQP